MWGVQILWCAPLGVQLFNLGGTMYPLNPSVPTHLVDIIVNNVVDIITVIIIKIIVDLMVDIRVDVIQSR